MRRRSSTIRASSGTALSDAVLQSMNDTVTVPLPRKSSLRSVALSASMSATIGAILYTALTPRSQWAPWAETPLVTTSIAIRPRWPR